jgi:uncharacterized protein
MKSTSRRVPGKTRAFLETRRFAQGAKAQIPVLTVTGKTPGPLAVIMAGQHGRELNGIAAIERAFTQLRPADLRGTVVFLPVMNPLAVRIHSQEFPTEKARYRPARMHFNVNMHASWGLGRSDGSSYAAAVTEVAWDSYVRHADLGIDLHGWSDLSLCLAWGLRKHRALLRAFGLPWHMTKAKVRKDGQTTEEVAARHGIPWLTCELVPQNRICREAVHYGERGILNALKFAEMLSGEPELPPVQYEFTENHVETVIQTPAEGLLVGECRKGDWVRQGQTVLRVLSLATLESVFEFKAPHDSLVFNLGGAHWGEDIPESFVVFPGQMVALLKQPQRILRNG